MAADRPPSQPGRLDTHGGGQGDQPQDTDHCHLAPPSDNKCHVNDVMVKEEVEQMFNTKKLLATPVKLTNSMQK